MAHKGILACGILAPLLYVSTDAIAAQLWHGYSYTGQTVSELFAIDAPTRPLIVLRGMVYCALLILFGLGVWLSSHRRRRLRIAGKLLVAFGMFDLLGPYAPMHQREVLAAGGGTLTDTLHIALAAVDVSFIVLIIGFTAFALGRGFRLYSIISIVVILLFGILGGMDGARLAQDLPTPWIGVTERISIFTFMLWLAVLSVTLLREEKMIERVRLGGSS